MVAPKHRNIPTKTDPNDLGLAAKSLFLSFEGDHATPTAEKGRNNCDLSCEFDLFPQRF